ncbi:MAG: winged helix-turn-helix domain-containing protein [Candidatus Saccharibacteria bacterium]|jgi:predicted ARSR subfamily of helix-turn-helix bacterial transcription regulatory protein
MLDVFIVSRVRRKIVIVYAKYPDFKTHVRGLSNIIKEDPGNIQRELRKLEKVGFLKSEKKGNTKIYYTNKQFIIFKELQGMVIKTQQLSSPNRTRRSGYIASSNNDRSTNTINDIQG